MISTGWKTVREITLGSSHLGAYSLTEEKLVNPTKYGATDKCHKRGIKYHKDSEDKKGTSN